MPVLTILAALLVAPKSIMVTHRSCYLNALGEAIHAKLDHNSRYLWILPLFHCNGWGFSWAVTAVCGMHVFLENLDKNEIITIILTEKITHFCAVPTLLKKIHKSVNFSQLQNSNLIRIFTAGSSPGIEVLKAYDTIGVEVIQVYGLT